MRQYSLHWFSLRTVSGQYIQPVRKKTGTIRNFIDVTWSSHLLPAYFGSHWVGLKLLDPIFRRRPSVFAHCKARKSGDPGGHSYQYNKPTTLALSWRAQGKNDCLSISGNTRWNKSHYNILTWVLHDTKRFRFPTQYLPPFSGLKNKIKVHCPLITSSFGISKHSKTA